VRDWLCNAIICRNPVIQVCLNVGYIVVPNRCSLLEIMTGAVTCNTIVNGLCPSDYVWKGALNCGNRKFEFGTFEYLHVYSLLYGLVSVALLKFTIEDGFSGSLLVYTKKTT